MTTEIKTIHSFWMPVRLLEELDEKRGTMSRNSLAISLIQHGLRDENIMKTFGLKGGSCLGNHPTAKPQRPTTEEGVAAIGSEDRL